MAAYAAVVSLLHVIEQIHLHHSRKPVFFVHEQLRQIESLREKVALLQDFLESFPNRGGINERETLESRIAEAAYCAEDILEFHVVHGIHKEQSRLAIKGYDHWNSNYFVQKLQEVIEKIVSVKKEVMRMSKDLEHPHQYMSLSSASVDSLTHPLIKKNDFSVGVHDDKLNEIMDKLTRQHSNFSIISITGMGGIGKTTLAKNVYTHKFVMTHFDIRAWVTVSQEYNVRQLLLCIIDDIGVHFDRMSDRENFNDHQLGEKIHKHLTGRRYLIVIDDLWSTDACVKTKRFLPDSKGSGILVTTRILDVANSVGSSIVYKMDLLDIDRSWHLLSRIVFGQGRCPIEVEEVGKEIARNCKGLPLSISVIGGLLVKSELKHEYWEHISKEISTTVNSEDNERCLKILSLSYYHLPVHLRPCFLFMGIFPEDKEIRVSELIRLWVAEGFLKKIQGKSLEEVARDYLIDLVERNLILASRVGIWNIKRCIIHDLLRDFCLREMHKDRFLHCSNMHNARRVTSSHTVKTSLARSVLAFEGHSPSLCKFILLRLFSSCSFTPPGVDCSLLVNLRYINGSGPLSSSTELLWNLHTIYLNKVIWDLEGESEGYLPIEIWKMPQLRHLNIQNGFCLRYPQDVQMDGHDIPVLQNLQTLGVIEDFKCTKEILHRIPNLKKLKLCYFVHTDLLKIYLNNLTCFNRIQSLQLTTISEIDLPLEAQFPQALKKLTLMRWKFSWEEITEKIGSLPHLEKLRIHRCHVGEEWNLVEGKFQTLKFLELFYVRDLTYWNAESIHVPRLEQLVLNYMFELMEIPSGIGEIETLRLIQLDHCSPSLVATAKRIIEEQRSEGNEDISLQRNSETDTDSDSDSDSDS